MKVNFQKLHKFLCIVLAVSICICACFVSVSADDYGDLIDITQDGVNYLIMTLENAEKLIKGEVTKEEVLSSQLEGLYPYSFVHPFQSETELEGVTNRDYANKLTKSVRDCLSQHGGTVIPTETTAETKDMHGYGAGMSYRRINLYDSSFQGREFYCDYIVIDTSSNKIYFKLNADNIGLYRQYDNASSGWSTEMFTLKSIPITRDYDFGLAWNNGACSYSNSTYTYTMEFYGDIRYSDGTPATDLTTPTSETIYTNDPSSLTDTQLIDLLQQMINQLKLDMPDLSTIEGLLAAILAQCQSINGKICTSSEIRSMINEAISQLDNNSGMSPEDLETLTCALDNLKYENNNEQFIADLESLIGMNGDYSEISKLEVVKSHFYEKTGFITELRSLCETAVLAYRDSDNSVSIDFSYNGKNYNINFDFWEQYIPMIRFMLAAVIYLGFAWRTYRKIPEYISGGGDDN